jgi:hypothetical protein
MKMSIEISDDEYKVIIRKSGIIQQSMMKYKLGIMAYQPPFAKYMMTNYQVFANFPTLL